MTLRSRQRQVLTFEGSHPAANLSRVSVWYPRTVTTINSDAIDGFGEGQVARFSRSFGRKKRHRLLRVERDGSIRWTAAVRSGLRASGDPELCTSALGNSSLHLRSPPTSVVPLRPAIPDVRISAGVLPELAASVSSRRRQEADFQRDGPAGQSLLAVTPGETRSRPGAVLRRALR